MDGSFRSCYLNQWEKYLLANIKYLVISKVSGTRESKNTWLGSKYKGQFGCVSEHMGSSCDRQLSLKRVGMKGQVQRLKRARSFECLAAGRT